jgi:multisubunit Na+/H+ antiporter MnhF subunit
MLLKELSTASVNAVVPSLTLVIDGPEVPDELIVTTSVLVPLPPVAAIVVVAVLLLTVWTMDIAMLYLPLDTKIQPKYFEYLGWILNSGKMATED